MHFSPKGGAKLIFLDEEGRGGWQVSLTVIRNAILIDLIKKSFFLHGDLHSIVSLIFALLLDGSKQGLFLHPARSG